MENGQQLECRQHYGNVSSGRGDHVMAKQSKASRNQACMRYARECERYWREGKPKSHKGKKKSFLWFVDKHRQNPYHSESARVG